MFGPHVLVPRLLAAGLSDPAEGMLCFSPPLSGRGCPGSLSGHPFLPLQGFRVGRMGSGRVAHSGLVWSKSLEAPTLPTATCSPGIGDLGTRPLGREPSAQAEPRGSQDVLGGWGLRKTWWEAEVRRKGHSFSLPFPQPSPVPGSQAPFSQCLVACLLSAALLDTG